LIGTQYGIWYVIVFALIFLFSQPPITVGAQSLILSEIPIQNHGTASAVMYVAYQFGSSLFLAIVNVVLGSTDRSTEEGLLMGYRNSMWTLLGIMALGLIVFVAFYIIQGLTGKGATERPISSEDEVPGSEAGASSDRQESHDFTKEKSSI
jgi:hypothetical protein